MTVKQEVVDQYKSIENDIKDYFDKIKKQAEKDLEIDEIDIDRSVLEIPKLLHKYNCLLTDEMLKLKDLYSLKEKVKLERWKYWGGKQTDKYYAENGIVHETILKSDIEKYLNSDEKLNLVNSIVSQQKALVDFIERTMKEIQTRNFHCKVIVDWRKFTAGQ